MRKKQKEKVSRGKPASDYDLAELALGEKWAVKTLPAYRRNPRNRRVLGDKVDRIMRGFSSRKLHTPEAVLDLNRELLKYGRAAKTPKAKLEQHAHFIALRASGQPFSDRELSKRIGVSRQTISEWRTPESTNAFLEEVNDPASPIMAMTERFWKGLPDLESTLENRTYDGKETHSLRRIELSAKEWLSVRSIEMQAAGVPVSGQCWELELEAMTVENVAPRRTIYINSCHASRGRLELAVLVVTQAEFGR
jgi:hypothetical protein